MTKRFYKVWKTDGKFMLSEDMENRANNVFCSIPRFSKVVNNSGSSWGNPETSERFREWLEDLVLTDGIYIAVFDYEYSRYGWARGSNWYGCMLYQAG